MGLGRATRGLAGGVGICCMTGVLGGSVYNFHDYRHDFDEDMTLWVFWTMELEQGYAGLAFFSGAPLIERRSC